ncbi:MAG: class I SAM-dependent methyltransferase [Bacteroidales bacterium]
MNLLQHASQYSRFLLTSVSPTGAEVPWLTGLLGGNHSSNGFDSHFQAIDGIRRSLSRNHTMISVTDYGAGPGATLSKQRKISDIAGSSSRGRKFSLLHYNLIRHLHPQTILELGTSFGFTTAVLAMGAPEATVATIEGCSATAAIAGETFKKLGLTNTRQVVGPFDRELETVLEQYRPLDYIFFDGNHRKTPTLNYFLKTLPYRSERAVFVFDDIRWSKPMTEAWEEITRHPDITLSVDLYSAGIIFFDPQLPGKHLKIRY